MNNSIQARKIWNMIAADSVGGDIEKYEKYSKVVVCFFFSP